MLDRIVRIESPWHEYVEPLYSVRCFEDGTDTPAQVIFTPVFHQSARALDGEESAVRVHWVLVEEASRDSPYLSLEQALFEEHAGRQSVDTSFDCCEILFIEISVCVMSLS